MHNRTHDSVIDLAVGPIYGDSKPCVLNFSGQKSVRDGGTVRTTTTALVKPTYPSVIIIAICLLSSSRPCHDQRV